jgi:hypothetical protein
MLIDIVVISILFSIFAVITWKNKHHVIGSILLLIVLGAGIGYNKYIKRTEVPISTPTDCTPSVEQLSQEQSTSSNGVIPK